MEPHAANVTVLQGLLGYLNFSTGRADPRAQAQVFALWESVANDVAPWQALERLLRDALTKLHAAAQGAFRDVQQAEAVLQFALIDLPAAYRRHHADLLFHQTDADLFTAGFAVRALEAVLAQQGPWDQRDRIVAGALKHVNDYVGHRPVAVLETRPRGEPYDHEKVCALPLYLRGAGTAPGRYAALVERAVAILQETPETIAIPAQFDFELLDELACDPRAYDHNHPADKRPNYRFGEWDPHLIDNRGFYRRLVLRQTILEALLDRIERAPLPRGELVEEAATVLACLVLMASGLSGRGPDGHDSTVTLTGLLPTIAGYRDAFYSGILKKLSGTHAERLRQEAAQTRQPFGGARQHLNHYVAQQRAAQLQQRHLALLVAELGYPEAARRHAARVPAASQRMVTEIHAGLVNARILADAGRHGDAAAQVATVEEILHKAIACGAMVDPWNILGFQGVYPLFNNREESVPDPRIAELLQAVERLLATYAHLRTEVAAAGDVALAERLVPKLQRLAAWWDRFATTTVHGVHHVSGRDVAASADHVAEALTRWRERGETTSDLAFWRQQLQHFRTSKAFALVVEALLHKNEFRAAMALLMNWLSQADQVPLEDGEHSFNTLAMRWMLGVVQHSPAAGSARPATEELVRKFMDYLEANADEYWQVPRLERPGAAEELPPPQKDDEDALYDAAYEGVVYQDSTDDGNDAELLGFEPAEDFDLAEEAERLGKRLRFLSLLSHLFHLASRNLAHGPGHDASPASREAIQGWLSRGRGNYQNLVALMDAIHEYPVPAPSGSAESLVEFDHRNSIKHQLLDHAIGTCLEAALAVGSMQGFAAAQDDAALGDSTLPPRERALLDLEQALWRGDAATARGSLQLFLEHFQREPLMFTPLQQGGHPRQILRARLAQTLLRALVVNLPRLGLLRETYGLLRIAQTMEREQKLEGPRVTEYPHLVEKGCHASVEAVVATITDPAVGWSDAERVGFLARFIEPYLKLWNEHSRTMRLSILETVPNDAAWTELQDFVRQYGAGLFNNGAFMNPGNLRGILQRGVGTYLKYLQEHADPRQTLPLVEHLDRGLPLATAERHLQTVLHAVVENFEDFKDYNNSTSQSDRGENFHILLDFLRLKGAYERQAWQIRPLLQVHEVLVQHHVAAADLWHRQIERETQPLADSFVGRLAELEKHHGMRLRTVGDRIRERLVQPLTLDRVSALIEPAYDAARAGGGVESLVELEAGLQPYLEAPIGSGLDVPVWVRRLEDELNRVKTRRTALANLAENLLQVPRIGVPVEQLLQQLDDWPRP